MAKKKTLVVLLLDETGSMAPHTQTTLSGYNEYIKSLRKEKITFSLIQFNSDKLETVLKGVPIKDVPELTSETYRPAAVTPLYDAIAHAIKMAEGDAKGKKVLITVYTDGLENASREFNRDRIFKLIGKKKKKDWTFTFLGADIDSFAVGGMMGLDVGNIASTTKSQGRTAFSVLAAATARYTSSDAAQTRSFYSESDIDRLEDR
jgi:hypothetical protein